MFQNLLCLMWELLYHIRYVDCPDFSWISNVPVKIFSNIHKVSFDSDTEMCVVLLGCCSVLVYCCIEWPLPYPVLLKWGGGGGGRRVGPSDLAEEGTRKNCGSRKDEKISLINLILVINVKFPANDKASAFEKQTNNWNKKEFCVYLGMLERSNNP